MEGAVDELTDRELGLLKMHATHTIAATARHFGIAPQTVANSLVVVYQKLGVGSGTRGGTMPMARALVKLGWLRVP
jgi:DNA-binding NarL/FixJ family response regulator